MRKYILFVVIIIEIMSFSTELIGQLKLDISKLENPYPGYLIFDFPQKSSFGGLDNYGYFVDESNSSMVYQNVYPLRNGQFALFATDKYYIYSSNMQLIDSIPNPTQYELDFHEFISLSNGHYLMLVNEYRTVDMSQLVEGGKSNAILINNIIIETDRNGNIYWSWSSLDHLNILDATKDVDLRIFTIDYAHINAMFEDASGNILISIRNFDEISLIEKSSGNFIWRMGGTYCKNNQFQLISDSDAGFTGFSHQHSPSILPNGNILLFDNGNLKSTPFSRAVEYSMNYSAKTATKVWEYRKTPDVECRFMGSASRLPNGNTLINWSLGGISEVKQDKTVAFEITSMNSHPVYRVTKVKLGMSFATNTISNAGEYNYSGADGNTGAKVVVSSISNSTPTYLQKHNYPPHPGTYNDNIAQSLLPYRWVLTPDKNGVNIIGSIKFTTTMLGNIENPSNLVIYKRDKEGSGDFQLLSTSYNAEKNEISASFTGWGEFVVGLLFLKPPTLLSPYNEAYAKVDEELTWSSVYGATSYRVEVCKDESFLANKISEVVNLTKYKITNLDFNSKYYWRIKAMNPTIGSEWSEVRSFTTTLASPVLVNPAKESFGFRWNDTLAWNIVDGAEKYHIQVSTDSNFFSPLINNINLKNNFFLPNVLGYNLKYYWRVRAFNSSNSGLWSEVFSFTSIIATPTPSMPTNLSINMNIIQTFTWGNVDGVESYLFEIAYDDQFINIMKIIPDLQDSKIEIGDLEYDLTYFWRVKAARTTDTSDWSQTSQFTTLLTPITLQAPKNNSTKVAVSTLLSWGQQVPGTKYKLQLGTDYNFMDNEIDNEELTENFLQSVELKPNTQYIWRVMAHRGDNISDWSEVWTFKTGAGVALQAPVLLLPKDKSETFSDVSIHWNKRVNAIKYTLQISLTNSFNNLFKEYNNLIESNVSIEGLQENTIYFWRVKAFSKYDSSKWSEPWQFNVVKGNNLVELINPGNDELQIPLTGSLEWNLKLDVNFYTVQLSDNTDFHNPVLFEDIYNKTSIEYPELKNNTIYYWRVRYAKLDTISDWSEVWTFTTKTQFVLDIPKLISHQNGMTGVPIEGTINWDEVKNADEYQISISNQGNFSTIYFKQSGIKGTELNYSGLDYSTLYYIRASSANESSKSSWSEPIAITTEMMAPALTFPMEGDNAVEPNGQILWTSNEFDYLYHIQISKDLDFGTLLVDERNFDFNNYEYNLEAVTKYYCRVKTYNDTNFSRWSNVVSFTTKNPTSVVDDNLYGEFIQIYPNPIDEILNIKFKNLFTGNIQILSIEGIILLDVNLNNQSEFLFNASKLVSGMYLIKIGNITEKFVKI